jgi:hypothetical protein
VREGSTTGRRADPGRRQSSPAKSAAVFPTYQAAANGPAPDFPSNGPLYEDGYNNYPRNPVRSVTQTPGAGGAVTAFVQPLQPPPTPLEQNPAWQEVNRQLGAQFNLNMVGHQQAQQALLPVGVEDPTWGTFSQTYLAKGRSMETTFGDGIKDVISGRRRMSDYDQLVNDWRTGGGDAIRKDYLDQLTSKR